jgi:O-antigen/teichoic acid export membrane protein
MRGLLRWANWSVFLASLGLALCAALISWALHRHESSQILSTLWMALPLLPLIALTQVRQGAAQGLHQVVLGSVPERLIRPALMLIFLGTAYLYSHHHLLQRRLTAPLVMALDVVATGIAFVVGTRLLHGILPQAVKQVSPVYRDRTWIRSALPMVFLAGMGVLFAQADTVIVGALKGAQAVGLYSAADKGAEWIIFVLVAQNAAFGSTAASLYAEGDRERLQRLTTRMGRMTLAAVLPVAVLLIGFGRSFLYFCYGPQFTQASKALAVLSVGQLAQVFMGPAALLLIMTGHEAHAAITVAGSAGTNIVLNLILVPRWGMDGAAIANASSVILLHVLFTITLYRRTGLYGTALGKVAAWGRLFSAAASIKVGRVESVNKRVSD